MLVLATIACSVGLLATSPPDSIEVCDSSDYLYNLHVGGGFLEGTVVTNRCEDGVVEGIWWRGSGRIQFEFTVHLGASFPPCCPGYTTYGEWDHQANAGHYTWRNFGGEFCNGQGLAHIWLCDDPGLGDLRPIRGPGVPHAQR